MSDGDDRHVAVGGIGTGIGVGDDAEVSEIEELSVFDIGIHEPDSGVLAGPLTLEEVVGQLRVNGGGNRGSADERCFDAPGGQIFAGCLVEGAWTVGD